MNTIYTGITETTGEIALPKENHSFVLVSYHFLQENVPCEAVQLKIGENIYGEAAANEHLLALLGYPPLQNMSEEKSEYYSVFEVPQADVDTQADAWSLAYNGNVFQLEGRLNFTPPQEPLTIAQQWAIERNILEEYAKKEYSFASPYVILNPYGTAPQAALVLFETENPQRITVTIEGKTESTTYSYAFEAYDTHHEIPVVGLYADYNNKVLLEAFDAEGSLVGSLTLEIQTDYLPRDLTMDVQRGEDLSAIGSDLFFLINGRHSVVDLNGDVRWRFADYGAVAGAIEVLENGRFLFSRNVFDSSADLLEMDFLGKIHWVYYDGGAMHHDAASTPDGNIAFIGNNNSVKVINRESYSTVKQFDFAVFSEGKEDLEIRHSGELLHTNTINFTEDGDMLLSFRNQHMVTRMDYETEEIRWILSPSIDYYPELADKFLTPVGDAFEWFYSQHEPTILPDLDGNPDTTDLLLFDNGDARGLYGEEGLPLQDRYSRVVHYRIDEAHMTVEQIFDFGKEYGFELFSSVHSGAQYLETENAYLGAFDAWYKGNEADADGYQSQVIQVDKEGNVLWRLKMLSGHYLYRCYKDSFSALYQGIVPLYTSRADLFVNHNPLTEGAPYDLADITYNISSLRQTGPYLNITGWGYVNDVPLKYYPIYLQMDRDDGLSYRFGLLRSSTNNFREEFRGIPNPDVDGNYLYDGFSTSYMNLNFVDAGEYNLSLVFSVDGHDVGQPIHYSLTVGEAGLNYYSLKGEQRLLAQSFKANQETAPTFEAPSVILDPYHIAPLAALVEFSTETPAKVALTVRGKDEVSTLQHDFAEYKTVHQIPVYGLYPDANNEVLLTLTDEAGNTQNTTLHIQTAPLPEGFVSMEIHEKHPDYQQAGLNFATTALSGLVGFDANGDIRWYTSKMQAFGYLSPVTLLQNGNLAIWGGELVAPYYSSHVLEVNLLGQIIQSYEVPRNSGHHEIAEMENGNLLALSGHTSVGVAEDAMVEFDRNSGQLVKSVDFKDVLPMEAYLPSAIYLEENRATAVSNLIVEGTQNPTEAEIEARTRQLSAHDWFHANAFFYDPAEGTVTVCSRNLNAIVKFDYETLDLVWIFADPQNSTYADNPHLREYLLTPADSDFLYTYGQHSVRMLSNGNLILFDNRYNDNALQLTEDESNAYSRIAVFSVDESAKTIALVWEWGRERGNELYSGYVSNVQVLSDQHLLCNFGGIVYNRDTGIRTRSVSSVFTGNGLTTAVFVELLDGEVIFEAQAVGEGYNNVYRCYRIDPYGK
ncbi:aryl-sulfate sulfotransferase [Eubacteriales bacterium OttesenSCG-928-A19]|nr:aryl-sulfate sulfotransferase [Eubacteriales bacterium OttesenSCG-928-A19]